MARLGQSPWRTPSPVVPTPNTHFPPVITLHHGPDVRHRIERVRDASAGWDDGNDFRRVSLWYVRPCIPCFLPCLAGLTRTFDARTAVSFPHISAHTTRVSIPRIVFFIGKHFGTGVILSTAFVHLLQDAFKSLNSHHVREVSRIGDWTGLIVWVSWDRRGRTN